MRDNGKRLEPPTVADQFKEKELWKQQGNRYTAEEVTHIFTHTNIRGFSIEEGPKFKLE